MAKASQAVIRRRRSWHERFKWVTTVSVSTSAQCREAALVDVAIVERALEDLIRTRLPKLRKKHVADLFEDFGVLSSLSNKTRMADAMGLLGPQTRSDLDKLREIRNIFAHSERPITFKSQRIKDLCDALFAPRRYPADNPEYIRQAFGKFKLTANIVALDLAIRPLPGRRFRRP